MDYNLYNKDEDDNNNDIDEYDPTRAAQQVRKLLSDFGEPDAELNTHTLFIQMDVLVRFPEKKQGWKEMARWMKYEETVEVGDRWSKPHIPTTQMHSLIEVRKLVANQMCIVVLNAETKAGGEFEIADAIMEALKADERFHDSNLPVLIRDAIKLPHKHQHRKASGKSSSTTVKQFDREGRSLISNEGESLFKRKKIETELEKAEKKKKAFLRRRSGDGRDIAMVFNSYPAGVTPDNLEPYKPNKHLMKKLPENCESASILVGQVDFLTSTVAVFCRMRKASSMADLVEVSLPTKFVFLLLGSTKDSNIWEFQEIGRTMGTLLSDKVFIEVAYLAKTREDLINGIDEFIDDVTVLPPSIWEPSIRLEPPKQTVSMDRIQSRLDVQKRMPTGPSAPQQEEGATDDKTLERTGKICGGLVQDIRKRYKHYLSDITDALALQSVASTVFLFFACITPIVTFGGLMGQKTDGYMGTMETLLSGAICGTVYALFAGQPLTIVGATGPLLIFESILYYLCKENHFDFMSFRFWIGFWVMIILLFMVAFDLSFLVRYITRFTEESFAILISVIFIYEAFTKIFEIYQHNPVHVGIVREEADFRCYCDPGNFSVAGNFSAGGNFSDGFGFNDSDLVSPNNSAFDYKDYNISDFFNNITNTTTIITGNNKDIPKSCYLPDNTIEITSQCMTELECSDKGWTPVGPACYIKSVTGSISDVFFLSVLLFIGTFSFAMMFRKMRNGRFFPAKVRSTFADFAVLLSVVTFTGIDYAFGINTPKLNVPAQFVTTRSDRSWIINPMLLTHWWLALLAIVPALLATILIFLDQQITAVIINRKEHKLKKGHGYHLDLLVLSLLIFVCSLCGLPWFVAATVRSITHVQSLMMMSEVSIPGERPQMVGVREQRMTGFMIHLLIGLSTLLTVVLRLIPMPVLYGVFLYMGITSLSGVQFIQRISILLMPVKYQPDYVFLRHVKTLHVHAFTIVQLVCFVLMWVVKAVKATSIAFPLMLIALIGVRKLLDYVFTQSDLYWLDHLLPEEIRREQEDQPFTAEDKKNLIQKPEYVSINVADVQRRRSRTRSSIVDDPSKYFARRAAAEAEAEEPK